MKKETNTRVTNKYFTELFAEFEAHSIYESLLLAPSVNNFPKLDVNERVKDFVKRSFQQNVTESEFHEDLSLVMKKKESVIQELLSSCLCKIY